MIKVVFAVGFNDCEKWAFGNGDGLPWPHCKEDMKIFMELTRDSVVVMGANTWKSLPKTLPGRVNVVMSKYMPDNKAGEVPDQIFHGDLYNALHDLQVSYPDKDICVIGGVGLIEEAVKYADVVHVNWIMCNKITADTYIRDEFMVDLMLKCSDFAVEIVECESDHISYIKKQTFYLK